MINRNQKRWNRVFENELVKLEGANVQKFDDDAFLAATKSGDFLPRLQLMTSNSDVCKKGQFPINNYALVSGQNLKDLSAAVDILVIVWRPKALEIGEVIISVYDINHIEFTRIAEKSNEKDSGCMFGPEFLVWVPSVKQFATFFMGSKSTRRESPNLKALLKKGATLKSHLIETPKYSWMSPVIVPCTTPFELPDTGEMMEQIEKFNNPPQTEIEKVEAPAAGAETRAR